MVKVFASRASHGVISLTAAALLVSGKRGLSSLLYPVWLNAKDSPGLTLMCDNPGIKLNPFIVNDGYRSILELLGF